MMRIVRYIAAYPPILIITLIGFFFHMLIIVPSGSYYCFGGKCGFYFWGAHGHDSIWHLAISQVSFKTFPFVAPNFAGALLYGYNFLLDFFVFLLAKIFTAPSFIFFKILPVVWFLLFISFAVIFARKLIDSARFTAILLFFFLFGGSFGYFLTLYHRGTLSGSESLLAMQAGHTLLNVQFAFSLVVLLGILILLADKKITLKKIILLGFLIFLNFGLKLYAGLISSFLVGFFFLSAFFSKKDAAKLVVRLLIILLWVTATLFVFYNPLYVLKNGSVFIFSPFAHAHAMIEESNMVPLKNMVNARYFLQAQGGFSPRLLSIELFSLFLYIFFNLGTRFFGILYIPILFFKKRMSKLDLSILATAIFGLLCMALFIQAGEWWNTVQFFYYTIFLSNVFAAYFTYRLSQQKKIGMVGVVIVVILTIPINSDFIKNFTRFPAPAYIPQKELEAFAFLKKQKEGIVLGSLYDKDLKSKFSDPQPLYAYTDTSYIAAISGKQLYIGNENQLTILRIDYKKRMAEVREWNCALLEKVDYFYEVKKMRQAKNFTGCEERVENIFENEEATIYMVK